MGQKIKSLTALNKSSSSKSVGRALGYVDPIGSGMAEFNKTIDDLNGEIMLLHDQIEELSQSRNAMVKTVNAKIKASTGGERATKQGSGRLGGAKRKLKSMGKSAARMKKAMKVKMDLKGFQSEIKNIDKSIDKKKKEHDKLVAKRAKYYAQFKKLVPNLR